MAQQITVNNQPVQWEEGLTVDRVLKIMNYSFKMIVVRVNGELVKRDDFQTRTIPPEARVEVIHLVAGG